VFARRNSSTGTVDAYTSSRMSFYSNGSALTLSLLDARITTYMAEILLPPVSRRRRHAGGYGL
jgi:hypothetical protein